MCVVCCCVVVQSLHMCVLCNDPNATVEVTAQLFLKLLCRWGTVGDYPVHSVCVCV